MGWILLGACGGGQGGGLSTRAITAEEAEPLCAADCQHDIDCGFESDLAFCTSNCVGQIVGWQRADAADIILECAAALGCEVFGNEQCLVGIRPLAIHEEWETRCRVQLSGCLGDFQDEEQVCESTPDGLDAGFISLIAAELMPDIIACLDGPDCNERVDCLTFQFETHNIDF